MAEKPILFNGEMVRAILDGRKTQTRRVIKPKKYAPGDYSGINWKAAPNMEHLQSPYGRPGDLLWVRETHDIHQIKNGWRVCYHADNEVLEYQMPYTRWHDVADKLENYELGKTRPSIFMFRWASRITLRVNNVRVERVQNISEADAKAEGVSFWWDIGDGERQLESGWEADAENVPEDKRDYRMGFRLLWDSINANRGYSWQINPWVWVVEFELANK